MRQILSGMTPKELEAVVAGLGQPRFVARQLAQWLYQKQIFSFDEMTNVSKKMRELLAEHYELGRRRPVDKSVSKDGTVKYLFSAADGRTVEAVFIPDHDRATLCVSSHSASATVARLPDGLPLLHDRASGF